jgi:hypothetical protein
LIVKTVLFNLFFTQRCFTILWSVHCCSTVVRCMCYFHITCFNCSNCRQVLITFHVHTLCKSVLSYFCCMTPAGNKIYKMTKPRHGISYTLQVHKWST